MSLFSFLIFAAITTQVYCSIQCLNSKGRSVEWYILYKLPILTKSTNPLMKNGVAFYYMDALNPTWTLSPIGINKKGHHAVYNTLQQIYSLPSNSMFAMYNDQPPPAKDSLNHGHTKGVVAFDQKTGFWMVHSTPRFPPPLSEGYSWPDSAHDYGQTFLCVSYPTKMLDLIGKQFMFTYPKVYNYTLPSSFGTLAPDMRRVLEKKSQVQDPPWYHKQELTSLKGTTFTSYAKHSKFHQDLYDALLAESLQSSIYVESWHQKLASNCTSKFKVYDVEKVHFSTSTSFKESKDHAKWAVSEDKGQWTCIGDINRDKTQFKRGGGAVCMKNTAVQKAFSSLVAHYSNCTTV